MIASSGQAVSLHVRGHDKKRIREIVRFLQRQPWCGVVFTNHGKKRPVHEGEVDGTFSLQYAHLGGHERSADIVFTFPWTSMSNQYGVASTDYSEISGSKAGGAVETGAGNHGGIGPSTIRNTMLANGPDFKVGAVVRTPSSNVDAAPTLLKILGITLPMTMDGRALNEALVGGPDEEKVVMESHSLTVQSKGHRALLQESRVGDSRYIDKAWRQE